MPKDFNLGLVFLSYLVAVTASHVTLLLAARVRDPHATNWKLWVVCGGFAMGIGIWSMHFVATLALKLPIRVVYDLPLTALSWVFAIAACGEVWMAYTIGGFTFVILTATMLLSAYDERLSAAIVGGAAKLRLANEQLEERVRERTRTLAREGARKDAILLTALDCIISMDER